MNTIEFYQNNFNEDNRLSLGDNRHKVELYRKRFLYHTLIEKYQPKNILQIACGTGIHTKWLYENYPQIDIIATDLVPKHIKHINYVKSMVWDCCDKLPDTFEHFDMVLVEGAWYHIKDKTPLIKNLKQLNPQVIVIDWLSAWHDYSQRLLQDKKLPLDYANPRPNEPFVFDTEHSISLLSDLDYNIKLYPVDTDLRFGYVDLNNVADNIFNQYIEEMNKNIGFYDVNQTFIMNATEHGCYVMVKDK